MPNSAKAKHPSGKLEIIFWEEDHKYVDSFGIDYISSTTLVHNSFTSFDSAEAAARKSARTGISAETYLREWQKEGEKSAEAGTRTHENCERQILGLYDKMNQPWDNDERARFRAAWQEVERMQKTFKYIEPEKLVFSPRFRVAGSIDVLARRHDGTYCIIDWKIVKKIYQTAFQSRTGIHLATQHLPDCNFSHYTLQTNIYEQILKIEGYIPMGTVDKYLAVYNQQTHVFDFYKCADLPWEALLLMSWNVTCEGLEAIPF